LEQYPPYKILITFLVVALPLVLYFWLTPAGSHRSGWFNVTSVSPALVYAVPEVARTTRKGMDVPMPDPVDSSAKEAQPVAAPEQSLEFHDQSLLLAPFFHALDGLFAGREGISVLHLGDSQLEEDRITMYLRSRLCEYAGLPVGSAYIEVKGVPMRGSAGIDIHTIDGMDAVLYLKQHRPDLIVFQYGINVVRASTRNFGYYTRALVRQIEVFRQADPEIPIVLIGVSEMASRRDGVVEGFHTVPLIRDAQKVAVEQSGCVFWDLYEVMGGEGAAYRWYLNDPPLMREDLTHFSWLGGKRIADGLLDAIIWEYEQRN